MKLSLLSKGVLVSLGLLTLASCGGGGGDGVASGGATGTGISQGPITGFGSVFVNGVKIEDTTAAITVEDAAGTRADLKVGMVVKVEWERDAAGVYTAKTIEYGDDVQGPVAIPGTANTLTVLGQSVIVNPLSTVFVGSTGLTGTDPLLAGEVVEVSGLRDDTGAIRATRIEVKTGVTEYELKGLATSSSGFGTSFGLGGLTISYTGTPAVVSGNCVEVKSGVGGLTGTTLTATRVEIDDDCTPGGVAGNELEIKGFVSALANGAFIVNGQSVSYSGSTVITGGTLANGANVEVEGTLNSSKVLVAKKISFEIEGANEGKGLAQGAVALDGTFTVILSEGTPVSTGSRMFTVNDLTTYEDDTTANFGRANIAFGQTLKVYYYTEGGAHIATRIKRE